MRQNWSSFEMKLSFYSSIAMAAIAAHAVKATMISSAEVDVDELA